MLNWKNSSFWNKVPKPIKWMFTRVGRVMVLGVLAGIVFSISQIPSISYDANAVLFYSSMALAIYPLLAGLWYILNGLILNPFIMLTGEDPKNKVLNRIVKLIRKMQFKIR